MSKTLDNLQAVLNTRKNAKPDTSYVASLYAQAPDSILKKIGEEATEVVIAGKDGQTKAIVHEIADLWFHTMVLLAQQNIDYTQVMDELDNRFGTSGITEKASRKK